MSNARRALLKIDRERKDGARKLAKKASTVSQILGRMGQMETYVARHAAAAGPAVGAAPARALTRPGLGLPRLPAQRAWTCRRQPTIDDSRTHDRKVLIAWLSGGVLLLVVYISAGTVLSIVRPVRPPHER